MTDKNDMEKTKAIMGALVRMKPKPHTDLKAVRSRSAKPQKKKKSGK